MKIFSCFSWHFEDNYFPASQNVHIHTKYRDTAGFWIISRHVSTKLLCMKICHFQYLSFFHLIHSLLSAYETKSRCSLVISFIHYCLFALTVLALLARRARDCLIK